MGSRGPGSIFVPKRMQDVRIARTNAVGCAKSPARCLARPRGAFAHPTVLMHDRMMPRRTLRPRVPLHGFLALPGLVVFGGELHRPAAVEVADTLAERRLPALADRVVMRFVAADESAEQWNSGEQFDEPQQDRTRAATECEGGCIERVARPVP